MNYPATESVQIEFKRELPKTLTKLIQTSIAFCNTHGGKLVIGVNDDGVIVGLDELALNTALETLETTIVDNCLPHITPVLYTQLYGDKTVLVIEIFEGNNKPYFFQKKGPEHGTYVRLGRHTKTATPDIIEELKLAARGIDYERLPIYSAKKIDLNFKAIKEFLKARKVKSAMTPSDDILQAYHLMAYDQSRAYPSVLGILVFGENTQNFLSEAMIICSHFQGTSGREIVASFDYEGGAIEQIKGAMSFIQSRLYKKQTINHLIREEQLEIPITAIREAVVNAVAHRNYHIKAPIKIAIYDDRIEIFSPGQCIRPIDTHALRHGISALRNPGLCKILREAGYAEKLGSGIIAILDEYEKAQLALPTFVNGGDYFKCILPREQERAVVLSDEDKIIKLLHQQSAGMLTVNEVISQLQVSRATAIRKLNSLLSHGRIVKHGQTRSTYYTLP